MKLTRILTVLAVGAAAAVLLPAQPAAAHVTVSPATATAGGRGTFTFKVPNERPDADTTKVEVVFPPDVTMTSVSLRPVPGWTATVNTRELPPASAAAAGGQEESAVDRAVTGIVWQGGAIRPGEFQTFDVALGPLPTTPGKLVVKALQTYSSGEVVRWIEVPRDGAARPAHPAMVIDIQPAAATQAVPAPTAAPVDDTARTVAYLGLAAGLLALVAALVALVRRRPGPRDADAPSGGAPAPDVDAAPKAGVRSAGASRAGGNPRPAGASAVERDAQRADVLR
ncbi:YcnI family protein [Luedemannella helvata]|uniref:YncI copper-binding domain-containing protein n=1 Tax=Luedemannella helvata TaxID=349315 RepID=A0ABN2JPJ8_9ACTN